MVVKSISYIYNITKIIMRSNTLKLVRICKNLSFTCEIVSPASKQEEDKLNSSSKLFRTNVHEEYNI